MRTPRALRSPRIWTSDELEADIALSAETFRQARLQEPVEAYSNEFEKAQSAFEDLLEETLDIRALRANATEIFADREKLDAIRYVAGPPISIDGLKILAESSLAISQIRADTGLVDRLFQIIVSSLDRRRFPWVMEDREPSEAERLAAIIASAALAATRKVETARRTEGKRE
jgi:hypothetical protein